MDLNAPMNQAPLDEAELAELDHLLTDMLGLESAMNLPMLDGFFAALLCGPRTLLPSEWLPIVWDPEDGEAMPSFENAAAMERFLALALRHMNHLASQLAEAPEDYMPLLYVVGATEAREIASLMLAEAGAEADATTSSADADSPGALLAADRAGAEAVAATSSADDGSPGALLAADRAGAEAVAATSSADAGSPGVPLAADRAGAEAVAATGDPSTATGLEAEAGTGAPTDAGDDQVPLPFDWCEGFLRGVRTDLSGWEPYLDSGTELFPVAVAFGSQEGLAEIATRPDPLSLQSLRDVSLILLPEIVREAHAWFLPGR